MAISLRDKLKAVDAPKPQAAVVRPSGVFVQEKAYPLDQFPYLFDVTHKTLSLMDRDAFPMPFDPYKVLYLDTETTGLSTGAGTIAFLVGVGYLEDDSFIVKQFLMRDYCDEAPMLKQLTSLMESFDMLVTFNGRSYDLPLLNTRLLMNRMRSDVLDLPHADLLHIARRIFKMRLTRCNLSFLEEAVFGEPREDDLPGAMIPQRYFSYLKTGQFSLLTDILEHNQQDIASLCRLLAHMAYMYDHPSNVSHLKDVYSIGVALEKRREHALARHCYHLAATGETAALSHERLAMSYKRDKELLKAKEMFETMVAKNEGGVIPYIELAKLFEHRFNDADKALNYVRKALIIISEPTLFDTETVHVQRNALQYRYDRLLRKLNQQKGDKIR